MANNSRIYVDVFDPTGVLRRVRTVDAREIIAAGGSYQNPADAAIVKESPVREKKADPVTANKKKAE